MYKLMYCILMINFSKGAEPDEHEKYSVTSHQETGLWGCRRGAGHQGRGLLQLLQARLRVWKSNSNLMFYFRFTVSSTYKKDSSPTTFNTCTVILLQRYGRHLISIGMLRGIMRRRKCRQRILFTAKLIVRRKSESQHHISFCCLVNILLYLPRQNEKRCESLLLRGSMHITFMLPPLPVLNASIL